MTSPLPDGEDAVQRAAARQRPSHGKRERLDVLVVARGIAPSRERARALIMAGQVRVDGRLMDKPGTPIAPTAEVALAGQPAELRYVSRGGLKLEHALDCFGLDPAGEVCLDVGASTGGFTDVLLRRGATRVYAVDVGRGQLAWQLRTDPRVVVLERTNMRHLTTLPEPVGCAAIDVSFISLRLVLPAVAALVTAGGWIVALVKPQFEAGRAEADRGAGVISDPAVHQRVLRGLLGWLREERARSDQRLFAHGLTASPIVGRDGNHEYLLRLQVGPVALEQPREHERAAGDARAAPVTDMTDEAIETVIAAAFAPSQSGRAPSTREEHP
jgi:23S rRNA (cytidine1920-2'-O)/16S rRNA (cytidine1409-2'-O)-methyltransferase